MVGDKKSVSGFCLGCTFFLQKVDDLVLVVALKRRSEYYK